MSKKDPNAEPRSDWIALAAISVLVGFGYVFLEWLFVATKPSFMSSLPWGQRLHLLLEAGLPFMVFALVPCLIAGALAHAVRVRWVRRGLVILAAMVPGLMIAVLATLMFDNFTLTVFDFGIRGASGHRKWFYDFVFLAVFAVASGSIWKAARRPSRWSRPPAKIAAALVFLASAGVVTLSIPGREESATGVTAPDRRGAWPNIVILGSDGLAAMNTSLYGYERETTPFLKELAQEALVCDNAFSNASHTGASLVSMLSGKLPTETRVIYPPDILHGKNAYQHLPAILRQFGYHSIQISMRFYADVFDLNMRHSFDEVNSRSLEAGTLPPVFVSLFGQDVCFFLETMADRVGSRVLHLTGIRPMVDVFAEVAQAKSAVAHHDSERLSELFDFIDSAGEPFFAQVHLMKTHPGGFHPSRRHFSHEGSDPKSVDAYDDCILEFDGRVRQLVDFLRSRGLFEHTILVIYSDHGPRFVTNLRVPLLFRFPRGEHSGHIHSNVQLTDVAPTLLDELGLEKPGWMSGQSLLRGEPDRFRPIFSVLRVLGSAVKKQGLWRLEGASLSPPFFSLGRVTVVVCNEWYSLNLARRLERGGLIEHHSSPCSPDELPSPQEERSMIVDHLRSVGYDVSSLTEP